jgi:hypothetical protein
MAMAVLLNPYVGVLMKDIKSTKNKNPALFWTSRDDSAA